MCKNKPKKRKEKKKQVCGSSVFDCASVSIVLAYVHQFKGNKVCVYMYVCMYVCVCVCVTLSLKHSAAKADI